MAGGATLTADERNAAVSRVQQLLADNPGMSRRAACRQVGVAESTVRRLEHEAGLAPPALDIEPGEIPVVYRDYRDLDKLHVFPLGDIHKGSPNFQAEKWAEWLAYIHRTPGTSLLGTGDFLNAAIVGSVSSVYGEEQTVQQAKWSLIEELRPVNEVIDLLIPGNHEARITRSTGECPIYDVARVLGVPYAPAAALVVYRVGQIEYDVYVRHGSGSGRASAQAGRMERESQVAFADIYVSGHTHRQQVIRGATFLRERRKLVRRRQVYVTSGSFLSYEDYAASSGLPPADIGAPRIRLDGTRRDAHVSI